MTHYSRWACTVNGWEAGWSASAIYEIISLHFDYPQWISNFIHRPAQTAGQGVDEPSYWLVMCMG